jgi:hypothetical protein
MAGRAGRGVRGGVFWFMLFSIFIRNIGSLLAVIWRLVRENSTALIGSATLITGGIQLFYLNEDFKDKRAAFELNIRYSEDLIGNLSDPEKLDSNLTLEADTTKVRTLSVQHIAYFNPSTNYTTLFEAFPVDYFFTCTTQLKINDPTFFSCWAEDNYILEYRLNEAFTKKISRGTGFTEIYGKIHHIFEIDYATIRGDKEKIYFILHPDGGHYTSDGPQIFIDLRNSLLEIGNVFPHFTDAQLNNKIEKVLSRSKFAQIE